MPKRTFSRFFLSLTFFALPFSVTGQDSLALAAEVTIQWTSVPNATGYTVHIGDSSRYSRGFKSYLTRGGKRRSLIDVGKQTTFTTELSPGTFYVAITAYNASLESSYSEEVSVEIPDLMAIGKCLSDKVKAAAILFNDYTRGYETRILNHKAAINRTISKAETKFENRWEQIEALAARKGVSCSMPAPEEIESMEWLAAEEIFNRIASELDLQDSGLAKEGRMMLRAASQKGFQLLLADSRDRIKPNAVQLAGARNRVDAKFVKDYNKILFRLKKSGHTVSPFFVQQIDDTIDILLSDLEALDSK